MRAIIIPEDKFDQVFTKLLMQAGGTTAFSIDPKFTPALRRLILDAKRDLENG